MNHLFVKTFDFSEARKMPIDQIEYKDAIAGLDMTKEQFIDLCILLGCDYCESIKGIGQATAFKLIKEHGSLIISLNGSKQ